MEGHDDWPLVGREYELGVLDSAVASAGRGLVLVGEFGMGKSRLLRAVLDVTATGRATWLIRGIRADRSIPFGPVSAWLPDDWPVDGVRTLGAWAFRRIARRNCGGGGRLAGSTGDR